MFANTTASRLMVPCVVNGKAVSLPDSRSFPVTQSKTGKVVHLAQSANIDVALSAVEAAAQAFKSWKRVPAIERRNVLHKAADLIEQNADEATRRAILETSCLEEWPPFDCSLAAVSIRQNAATSMTVSGRIPPSDDAERTSLVFKEPVGVVLIIPP